MIVSLIDLYENIDVPLAGHSAEPEGSDVLCTPKAGNPGAFDSQLLGGSLNIGGPIHKNRINVAGSNLLNVRREQFAKVSSILPLPFSKPFLAVDYLNS